MSRPVRIGDRVRIVSERKGYVLGTICVVKYLDVLNNVVTIQRWKKYMYPWDHSIKVQLQDIEIVSSPEWQLNLL